MQKRHESLVNKANEGDRVVFHVGDQGSAPGDWGLGSDEEMQPIHDHDGQEATVTGIAVDDGDPASKIIDGPFYVDIKFDDGFELQAVDGYNLTPIAQTQRGGQNREPVAHDFIPAVGPESLAKQATNLVKKVMERTRKISENDGGPFAPGGHDDQAAGDLPGGAAVGGDIDAQAVQAVMGEVSQWHAGQLELLIDGIAELYNGKADELLNMDSDAIYQHLRAAAELLANRTGD